MPRDASGVEDFGVESDALPVRVQGPFESGAVISAIAQTGHSAVAKAATYATSESQEFCYTIVF